MQQSLRRPDIGEVGNLYAVRSGGFETPIEHIGRDGGCSPRFRTPITLVVMPDECQSMPMRAPNDWNQNGWVRPAIVVDDGQRNDGAERRIRFSQPKLPPKVSTLATVPLATVPLARRVSARRAAIGAGKPNEVTRGLPSNWPN